MSFDFGSLWTILQKDLITFIGFLIIPVAIEGLIAKFWLKRNYPLFDARMTVFVGIVEVATTGCFLFFITRFFKSLESSSLFQFQKDGFYYLAVFIASEFIFYIAHRTGHHVRWFWNEHRVHHSSREFNLLAGNRNGWTFAIAGLWIFSIPFVLLGFSWSDIVWCLFAILNYQFFIHTELIKTLGPLEWILNTPSLHRVHHATQDPYIDKNFSGIFLLFDYVCGTLQREIPEIKPTYGLKSELHTDNAWTMVSGGWVQMFRDFFNAPSMMEKLKALVLLKPKPGPLYTRTELKEYEILSPFSLSIFRVLLAAIWLVVLGFRIAEIPTFFSESGVLPLGEAIKLVGDHRFSLFYLSPSVEWAQIIFSVGVLAGLFLLFGIASNLSAFVSWIICVSMLNRSEVILSGGDLYLLVFLLLASFLPLDNDWSLKPLKKTRTRERIFRSAQLVYVFQIAALYFFAGLMKEGSVWKNGEALQTILQLKITTRPWAQSLLNFPELLKFVSFTIPWLEMMSVVLLFPLRALRPIRWIWLVAIMSMHLGILLSMQVFYLPYICLAALVPLIPSEFWQFLLGLTEQKKRLSFSKMKLEFGTAAFIASLIILVNFHSTVRPVLSPGAMAIIEKLRLEQNWNFFGPVPNSLNTWWTINGKYSSGESWSWNEMKPTQTDLEPPRPAELYKSLDWAVYFLGLAHPDYRDRLLPVFSKYLCRQAQQDAHENETIQEVSLVLSASRVSPQGATPPFVSKQFRYPCSSELFEQRSSSSEVLSFQ